MFNSIKQLNELIGSVHGSVIVLEERAGILTNGPETANLILRLVPSNNCPHTEAAVRTTLILSSGARFLNTSWGEHCIRNLGENSSLLPSFSLRQDAFQVQYFLEFRLTEEEVLSPGQIIVNELDNQFPTSVSSPRHRA